MMALLLKSYLMIFLLVGSSALLLLLVGLYWIFINQSSAKFTSGTLSSTETHFEAGDIIAIAGENVFSTQLDLARAYIETNRQSLAKHILDTVLTHGSDAQQLEAQKLLASMG